VYHQFGNSARLGVAWREIGGRSAALLVLFLVLVVMNVPAAQARKGTRIGVGIGAGIIGAIILNELAREDEVTKSRASSEKIPRARDNSISLRARRSKRNGRLRQQPPRQQRPQLSSPIHDPRARIHRFPPRPRSQPLNSI
jgi:hypothetical protein